MVVGLVFIALLALTVVSGLAVRRLLTQSFGFAAYVLAIGASAVLAITWPQTFSNRRVWLAIEVTHTLLRHLVALEVSYYTFKAFPAARRRLRVFLWTMTGLALAAPFLVPSDLFEFETLRSNVLNRMLLAAVGLFIGLGVLVLWYRLPLSRVHKAILTGFIPYLLVFNLLVSALRQFASVDLLDTINVINSFAWAAVAGFWAWVVWTEPPPATKPVPASSK